MNQPHTKPTLHQIIIEIRKSMAEAAEYHYLVIGHLLLRTNYLVKSFDLWVIVI